MRVINIFKSLINFTSKFKLLTKNNQDEEIAESYFP